MILCVDLENRYTNFGVFHADTLIHNFKVKTDISRSSDELYIMIKLILEDLKVDLTKIKDIIISSVVPDFLHTLKNISYRLINKEAIVVGVGVRTGLKVRCENPKEVGTDRIIRGVGALSEYDSPLIIVNLSHFSTVDVINDKNEFIGGLIFPGINIANEGMYLESATLPKVELVKPKNVIGNRTVTAMQSGLYYQYLFSIDSVIDRVLEELNLDATIILTGTFVNFLKNELKHECIVDPFIGFKGLKRIYELNS